MILNNGELWEPSAEDLAVWSGAYPNLDIDAELKKMDSWCHSNPARRKTKRGIKKFINGWLARAQPQSDGCSTRRTTLLDDLTDTSWA